VKETSGGWRKKVDASLMFNEEAFVDYLEVHQGRLVCVYGKTTWPDGTITDYVWQYSADDILVTAAKTDFDAVKQHQEAARTKKKEN